VAVVGKFMLYPCPEAKAPYFLKLQNFSAPGLWDHVCERTLEEVRRLKAQVALQAAGARTEWAISTRQAGQAVLVIDPAALSRVASLDEVGLARRRTFGIPRS
jgi:hypothetical protein